MLSFGQLRHRKNVPGRWQCDFYTQSFQPFRCTLTEFTLPYHDHSPPRDLKRFLLACVSFRIGSELLIPALDVRCRCCRISATGMAMPETTVNENCGSVLWQDEIRGPGQIAGVQPIAEALSMKVFPYRHFGLRILRPNT